MKLTDRLLDRFQDAVRGRYAIERELGRGAMGVVFLARDLRLDRPVAIKVLAPHLSATHDRALFLREARLAARLNHPHVVPIHSVEESGDFVFFAMAYVDGGTLGSRLAAAGPMSADEAGRLLREVAWALAYSHAQGIVHRDIKPDNVLLEVGTRRALVTDFGIARPEEDELGGTRLGTPGFASPEQASGDAADARSDIYALGALGFCLLTGRPPFTGGSREIVAEQLNGRAPRVREVAPGTPRDLAVIVDKCLAREPAMRYERAEELAAEIGRALPQVRELPPALRTWVVGRPELLSLAGAYTLVPIATATFYAGFAVHGLWRGVPRAMAALTGPTLTELGATVLVGVAIWTLAFTSRMFALRRLLASGVTLPQIRAALRSRNAQYDEENAVAPRPGLLPRFIFWTVIAHVIALLSMMAVAVNADTLGVSFNWFSVVFKSFISYLQVVSIPLLAASIFFPGRRANLRPTFFTERVKTWLSGAGDTMVKLASWRLPKSEAVHATANLPTELALEDATLAIFEALPVEQRRMLGDVKPTIERLARLAEEARRADATSDESPKRFGDAIEALETLRLGLLRLRAGSATLSGVTTYLRRAQDVTDQIGRLADAQAEVHRALRPAT